MSKIDDQTQCQSSSFAKDILVQIGMVTLLFLLFYVTAYRDSSHLTSGLVVSLFSWWSKTIWILPVVGTACESKILKPYRLVLLPLVLFVDIYARLYRGMIPQDVIFTEFTLFCWLVPFIFNIRNRKNLYIIRTPMILFAGAMTCFWFAKVPSKTEVERLLQQDKTVAKKSWIELDGPEITESHIALLSDSKNIVHLRLSDMSISNNTFEIIGGLTSLKRLYLIDVEINGLDIERLSSLENLEDVLLESIKFSGSGIDSIVTLKSLKELMVVDTFVKEDDLLEIVKMPSLEQLVLNNVDVSKEMLQEIKKINPQLEFRYYPPPDNK